MPRLCFRNAAVNKNRQEAIKTKNGILIKFAINIPTIKKIAITAKGGKFLMFRIVFSNVNVVF